MTGSDTSVLNNRVLTDLADANCIELTFDEDIASCKTGKNGNSIYSLKESGKKAKVKLRLVRGSSDDKYLNNLLVQMQASFETFVLMNGQFIKKIGDGLGNVSSDTYIMSGGIFTKKPGAKTNTDGEVDQSITEYMFEFSNAPRAIT